MVQTQIFSSTLMVNRVGLSKARGKTKQNMGLGVGYTSFFAEQGNFETIGERLGGFVGVDVNIEQRHHC